MAKQGVRYVVATTLILTNFNGKAMAEMTSENIALKKEYTLFPQPNSPHCAAGNAATKLTDGVYSAVRNPQIEGATDTSIWTMDTTVGWHRVFAPVITMDLGKDQPISGGSYSTAAGRADVVWPQNIFVQTSVDGQEWFTAGDLVALSNVDKMPPKEGRHRFSTQALNTHGRFIRFIIIARFYAFCDEIEVFRGRADLLGSSPAGEATKLSGNDWAASYISKVRAIERIEADAEAVAKHLVDADYIPETERTQLQQQLSEARESAKAIPMLDPYKFKAILPLGESHARVFSVFGKILHTKGYDPLVLWKRHRFDPLSVFEFPDNTTSTELNFDLMRGERRSDSFLLTNASSSPQRVQLSLKEDFAKLSHPQLRVFASLWTDTYEGKPVSDALVELPQVEGQYSLDIPAGLTSRIWITIDATRVDPGSYTGGIAVHGGDLSLNISGNLHVSRLAMGQPRLSLGLWDYTSGKGAFGITEENMGASIESMQTSFVDITWADRSVLPDISPDDFDTNGQLNTDLDFGKIDRWVARWPNAQYYAIYVNAPDQFAGSALHAKEFPAKVGSWAKTLSKHAQTLNIRPEQFILLLVDEPRNDLHDEIIVQWSQAIKKAAPEISLLTNPIWDDPSKTKNQEAITLANIVCPNLKKFMGGGSAVAEYFAQRRATGQSLWFYLCDGPIRNFDPSNYYRLTAWKAFEQQAVGIGFWSFGDLGGSTSSWNEYIQSGKSYAPAFLGWNDVTNSLHFQAIQEGVEDYECLTMLAQIASGTNQSHSQEAKALLDEALKATLAGYSTDYKWTRNADRSLADQYRAKILRLLERVDFSQK